MIAFAILTFLSTLGVVGLLIYKNLDKFIPDQDTQTNEVPSEAQEPLSENNPNDDVENVEESSLLEPVLCASRIKFQGDLFPKIYSLEA